MFAVPFGIIGGRIYHVITDNQLYFGEGRNPWNAFAIWNGGLGIWGAIAFGAVGAWIGCRYYKVPLSAYADSVAPGIAVAQAIGRLGNYFNQELFGAPDHRAVGARGLRPHPRRRRRRRPGERRLRVPDRLRQGRPPRCSAASTSRRSCTSCSGASAWPRVVVWADRRFQLGGGRAFAVYVAGYTLGRTWIEMLRIDPANHVLRPADQRLHLGRWCSSAPSSS